MRRHRVWLRRGVRGVGVSARLGVRAQRVRRLLDGLGFVGAGVAGWRVDAACVGEDPEVFFPVGVGPALVERVDTAKQVCAGCPVRELCLADVMASEDPAARWGVLGGLSAGERAELFAARRQAVA